MVRRLKLSVFCIPILIFTIAFIGNAAACAADLSSPGYNSPPNIYSRPQCTWYVWGRVNEVFGISLPNFGDAKDWYAYAENHPNDNWSVGKTPMTNSIAVFYDVGALTSGYGHVAYVESVNGDTIHISESISPLTEKSLNIMRTNFPMVSDFQEQNSNRTSRDISIWAKPHL